MIPLNYERSFVITKWPDNEIRFWIESRTRIIDERNGAEEDYLQCASCKSEETFVERDLFVADNYDFLPVFGPEYSVIFRRKAWLNPNYRSCQKIDEVWHGATYRLVECESARELADAADIIRAMHEGHIIVAQTELWNKQEGLRAIIEYPVKTLNTNRARKVYQVDTGPLVYPDLTRRRDRLVDTLSLAFVAFNKRNVAEFVIEERARAHPPSRTKLWPTMVYHYARRVRLETINRLYMFGPSSTLAI